MTNKSLDIKEIKNKNIKNLDTKDPVNKEKVSEASDENKLDSQTLDFIKRIRSEKISAGMQNSFYVPEDKKEKNYAYQWSSTDKDSSSNPHIMERVGWKKVDGWETIPTGGYTVDGQPGKHYLMKIRKEIHNELTKIQKEYAEKQKDSIYGLSQEQNLQMKVRKDELV